MGGKEANKIFKGLKFVTKVDLLTDPNNPGQTINVQEKDTDYDTLVEKYTE